MYVKVSDTVERLAHEMMVIGVKAPPKASPEEIAEAIMILKNPKERIMKTAGRTPAAAAILLYLLSVFGPVLADQGKRVDIAEEMEKMKLKGKVEFSQDQLEDMNITPTSYDLGEINKLLAEAAKDLSVQEEQKYEGFQQIVPVGKDRLMADNPKDLAALRAINKMVNQMSKDKTIPAGELSKKVKTLVDSFQQKKPAKFA